MSTEELIVQWLLENVETVQGAVRISEDNPHGVDGILHSAKITRAQVAELGAFLDSARNQE